MEFYLEPEEAELVARILHNYLGDLRAEIYKTENHDWREGLHKDEAVIKRLLERLGQPVAAASQ